MHDSFLRVCGRMVRGLAFVLAVLLGSGAVLQAAPVTFAFDAEVDQVTGNSDGLVQVVPGDIIHGSFTYEPTPFGVRSKQLNDLSFNVNGLQLASEVYEIILENDAALPSTAVFPGTPIFPGIIDAAHIACSFATNKCTPENIPSQIEWKWSPFITFSGNSSILANEELTSDLNWNGFGFRELQLRLENPSPDLGLSIQAIIGPLTLVPEPSAVFLAIIGFGLALLSLSQRQNHERIYEF